MSGPYVFAALPGRPATAADWGNAIECFNQVARKIRDAAVATEMPLMRTDRVVTIGISCGLGRPVRASRCATRLAFAHQYVSSDQRIYDYRLRLKKRPKNCKDMAGVASHSFTAVCRISVCHLAISNTLHDSRPCPSGAEDVQKLC